MEPGLSIVICCHNSERLLPRTLAHLKAQRGAEQIPWEVIIVDNESTDRTAEVALACWRNQTPAPLRVVTEPRLGSNNAHECGFREAKHQVLSFVDDDNWVADDWVAVASEIMARDPQLGAAGAIVLPHFEIPSPDWFEQVRGYYAILTDADFSRLKHPVERIQGAGMTVRKRAWRGLIDSGFNSYLAGRRGRRMGCGEDNELTLALALAGWKLRVEPRLRLQHFLPAHRLQWRYFREMARGYAASWVAIELYYRSRSPAASPVLEWLRDRWWWHLRRPLRELLRPHRIARALLTNGEGNMEVVDTEKLLGRALALLELRGRYGKIRRAIRDAPWRKLDSFAQLS